MNTFKGLPVERCENNEITTANKYRNSKKKLKSLTTKPQTPENVKKSMRLLDEINEYQMRYQYVDERLKPLPHKQKKKKKKKDEDYEFLEKAFQETKTKEYQRDKKEIEDKLEQEKRQKEETREREKQAYEDEKRRKEETREREKQAYEDEKRRKADTREREKQADSLVQELKRWKDTCPTEDILELAKDYDKDKYRKLAKKYHPDKNSCGAEYMKMIEMIKQHYFPKTHSYDNTWCK